MVMQKAAVCLEMLFEFAPIHWRGLIFLQT